MLLFDAIAAGLFLRFFSENYITALVVTCMFAFLRLYIRVNHWLNIFEKSVNDELNMDDEEEL